MNLTVPLTFVCRYSSLILIPLCLEKVYMVMLVVVIMVLVFGCGDDGDGGDGGDSGDNGDGGGGGGGDVVPGEGGVSTPCLESQPRLVFELLLPKILPIRIRIRSCRSEEM